MEIRSGSIFFPRSRGSGPRTANSTPLVFPRSVLRAAAGITGYTAQFLPDDHHLGQFRVQLNPSIIDNTVTVAATFGLRDWSGDWDDDYTGTVNFIVLAELEAATATPPRRDLQILDAEFNQVTQFFRSSTFLDPANIRPDNSVPLFERKPTGVRLYVDYDSSAGLPAITNLSGEIEVQSPAGTRVISPIASITPKREFLIQRGQVSDTLNFNIPEELCIGVVTLRARVFSASDPSSRSGLFERTVRFVNVPSVRTYLVGVNYTGQGLNLAAPSQAQVVATLNLTERLFPTGELLVTGYQVLPFNTDMNANISDGCGNGFRTLLDRLEDMRGNSSDIYYAELPAGVNTGNVGGCARGGVAASMNSAAGVAAHEVAHAFGIPHTPCSTDVCPIQPANDDSNYPQYGSFARGSIGEFGYDPLANTVFDPAITFDFMSYAGPQWMSPYNYARLMGAGGGVTDLGAAPVGFRAAVPAASQFRGRAPLGDVNPVAVEYLNLRLTIHRDRKVERDHSFHFPATRGSCCGHRTEYTAEILDGTGQTLSCVPLTCSCNMCRPSCYPVIVRDRIPMPPDARVLRVWEGRDNMIYEEEIPDPPALAWKGQSRTREGIALEWAPKRGYTGQDLRYIVQFEDSPDVWRGVAPRSTDAKIVVPWELFKRRGRLHVRVLASSGIATGSIDEWITLEGPNDNAPPTTPHDQPPVVVSPQGSLEPGKSVGPYLRAVSEVEALVRWYDETGAELSGSATLDLRGLPDGQHTVRAVAVGGTAMQTTHSLLVEKSGDSITFIRDFAPTAPDEPHVHPHPAPDAEQESTED
jgi:hypothetical protein